MKTIEEKNGHFLNFFKPAIALVFAGALLGLMNILIISTFIFSGIISLLDAVTVNLLILFLSQVSGMVIVYFFLIPFFNVKEVENYPLTRFNFLRTILLTCFAWSVAFISNFILVRIFLAFGMIPQTGYGSILLTTEHLSKPFTIFIYYATVTFGAAVFEELIYRRMVIPLLEKRGMAPFQAVLASSIVFAIAHFPNDLINGTLAGGIIHVWGVFIIAIILGLLYVISRNIIYPMIIHALINFMSFTGPLVIITGNTMLLVVYLFSYFAIVIIGVIVGIFAALRYFRKKKGDWIAVIKKKSEINIKPGLIGFFIIGIALMMVPLLIELPIVMLVINGLIDSFTYIILIIAGYAIFVVALLLLGKITEYNPNN